MILYIINIFSSDEYIFAYTVGFMKFRNIYARLFQKSLLQPAFGLFEGQGNDFQGQATPIGRGAGASPAVLPTPFSRGCSPADAGGRSSAGG